MGCYLEAFMENAKNTEKDVKNVVHTIINESLKKVQEIIKYIREVKV